MSCVCMCIIPSKRKKMIGIFKLIGNYMSVSLGYLFIFEIGLAEVFQADLEFLD